MNSYALFSLIASVLFIQAVIYLFFFEKRAIAAKEFAFVCFNIFIYVLFIFLMQITKDYEEFSIYYRLSSVARAGIPGLLAFFFFRISKSQNIVFINVIRYILLPTYGFLMYKYLILDLNSIKEFEFVKGVWQVSPLYQSSWFLLSIINFIFCGIFSLFIIKEWKQKAKTNRERKLAFNFLLIVGVLAPVIMFTYYVASAIHLDFAASTTPLFVVFTTGLFYYLLVKFKPTLSSPEILDFLILDQVKDFILFLDIDGKIVASNKHLLKSIGIEKYELQKLSFDKLFDKSDFINGMLKKSYQTGLSDVYNVNLINNKNEQIPVVLACLLNKDNYGNPLGFVLICNDYRQKLALKQEIIDRISREKELQKIKKDLESLVEKKTLEIFQANEKLKNEILERKRVELQIKSDLNKKVALIQEIHHRVKNNIQIIISLINMLATHEDIDKESAIKLKELGDKVRSISNVHEVFYSLPRLSRINFGSFLKKTTGELYSLHKGNKNILFRLNISDEDLDIDMAISCGIVFVELLTNALKFAFPTKGYLAKKLQQPHIIEIEFFKKDINYCLVVSDNGVGISWEKNIDKPEAIGLHLVDIIVKKHLKGNLNILSADGTKVVLEFLK